MFQPDIQDHNRATYTQILKKDDKIVDPSKMTALEIYNHYRAYINYPGTSFYDSYFGCSLRVLECFVPLDGNLNMLRIEINPVSVFADWVRFNKDGQNLVCRICQNQTLLPVLKICLENGQKINFSGYQFK